MPKLVHVRCNNCGHEWGTVKYDLAFCRECGFSVNVPRPEISQDTPAVKPDEYGWISVDLESPEVNQYGNSDMILMIVVAQTYHGVTNPCVPFRTVGGFHRRDGEKFFTAVFGGTCGRPVASHWQPFPNMPAALRQKTGE